MSSQFFPILNYGPSETGKAADVLKEPALPYIAPFLDTIALMKRVAILLLE